MGANYWQLCLRFQLETVIDGSNGKKRGGGGSKHFKYDIVFIIRMYVQ